MAGFTFSRILFKIFFQNLFQDLFSGSFYRIFQTPYLLLIAACAAASLAIGTRKGEQDT